MSDDLIALFGFNRWADERVIQALRPLAPEQYIQEAALGCPSVRAILLHMADTSLIWANRIRGEQVMSRTTEAEAPTLEAAVQLLAQGHDSYRLLIPTLSPEQLSAPISYRDFKGEPKSLPLWAILRHQLNHSSYHRGQISSHLMEFGIEPPAIDFAIWAFQGTNG